MIGLLPKSLKINDKDFRIHTDFRFILLAIQSLNDPNLDKTSKILTMLDIIIGLDKLQRSDYEEACKQVAWFIDGGKDFQESSRQAKLMDWEDDEQLIFSAVNKVAYKEVRETKYLHWWTFLGYFNEINDGLFSQVVTIRRKKAEGKKLEKYEKEFVSKNRNFFIAKRKLSDSEKEEEERLNNLFK